jgi:prepilin-type processing-associated H-X9-DG protein
MPRSPASCRPDTIVHGKKLIGIAEHGRRATLAFADGSAAEADLVIGADGAHSLVRDYVAGPEQPRFTGSLAYRTTFPSLTAARR